MDIVGDVLSYKTKVKDRIFTILDAKGSPLRVVLSVVPDITSEGSVAGVVGTIRIDSAPHAPERITGDT